MKRISKETKETTRTSAHPLSLLPGTLVLCGCTLVLFIGIMVAMYLGGMLETPQFLNGILGGSSGDNSDDEFSEDFLASLSGREVSLVRDDAQVLDTTSPEALLNLLLSVEEADSYYWTVEMIRTDGKAFLTETVRYLSDGARVYAEVYPTNGQVRTIVCDDDYFCITENGETRRFERAGEYDIFTPEGEVGLPSLSRMKQMITEAGEGKYTLSLAVVENTSCIRVSFTDTLSGIQEVFDVLPDVGVIYAATSCLPGSDTPYYQLNTISLLTDITGMDDATFASLEP